jgi:hypothetical protein
MFLPLLLGSCTLLVNLVIQVAAVVLMLRFLSGRIANGEIRPGFRNEAGILMGVLLVLFVGHLVQIGVWAFLFIQLGQFADLATAYYHSTVNFATLGYGDIVMEERWRLLGALQAASGVLMFGLSTSTLFAVMMQLFQRRTAQTARNA